MVEDDQYCIDILTQVSAVTRALQTVALGLLEEHLGHCVAGAVAQGGDAATEKIKEAPTPSPAWSSPERVPQPQDVSDHEGRRQGHRRRGAERVEQPRRRPAGIAAAL
jgi:hypothetical protein